MKKRKKEVKTKLLVLFIVMIMLSALIPISASAQGELSLDLTNGSIVITSMGYSQGGGSENAHTGGYIIKGTTTDNTIQVTSGTHNIILDGVTITIPATTATGTTQAEMVCAFSVMGNSSVTVTLQGNNTLTSAAGYAGLYVEVGSDLIVNGTGSLTALGGAGRPVSTGTPSYGGGAGIGGNGYSGNSRFGSITIDEGTITATGGVTSASVNYGAGAGIGSGGMSGSYPDPDGTIIINKGTINAYGGKCINSSDTGGGSGIGSGGCNLELSSNITIKIHNGKISALANNDGAGIGAGANCHSSGNILIDGGEVYAYGAGEGDGTTWGGAGIGGGDMGWVSSISIGGSAKVVAYGAGAAAGIGGGNYGGVWDIHNDVVGKITISANANVTAYGSTTTSGVGGAGIGAGRNYSSNHYNSGIITISDTANVTAYAGKRAQAIGVGTGYNYATATPGEDVLNIDDTITLMLFNQDTEYPAHIPDVRGNGKPLLVTFTLADSGLDTFPGIGERAAVTTGGNLTWEYSGSERNYDLTLFEGDNQINTFRSVHTAFGNWAVLYPVTPVVEMYTVTYKASGGEGTMIDENSPYVDGATVNILKNAFIKEGSAFAGFKIQGDVSNTVYAHADDHIPGALDTYSINASDVVFEALWSSDFYTLIVENGSGGGKYAAGTAVEIVADAAPSGKVFDYWETNNGGIFADKNSKSTIFTMPENNVTVTAVYKDTGISPETGDNLGIKLWISLALLLMAGMLYLIPKKRLSKQ